MINSLVYLFFLSFFALKSYAQSCPPNNPTGLNEDTLCIKHYIDIINPNSIDRGSGTLSHFGPAIDPIRPNVGTIFKDNPLPSNEFYTNVSAGDLHQGIRIETNKGRVFQNLNTDSEQ